MAIADDISVAANGDIRYTGNAHTIAGAGYYTVIDFHRFLQDLADDAVASGDDLLDITDDTPSDRSTDNIITLLGAYNIDDTLAEYLYDGSIIQSSGDTIYDGVINFGVEGIHIDIIQNGTLLSDTHAHNDFWNSVPSGETEKGLNRDTGAGISHRFMVKVRDSGSDIDGRRLLGINREFGFTYGEFPINGTSRGNNVLALTQSTDLNNQTVSGTVATWNTITNKTVGYANIDIDNDGVDEYYYSEWDKDTYSINQFYERMKYITTRGTSETLYGIDGNIFRGITHEINVDNHLVADFEEVEAVSWTGGTGQMLAVDDSTQGGASKIWIQLLTGVPPTDGQTITGGTSGATADVNVTVTERPLKFPFVGASTGSAIIGAYGVGIEGTDLTASDKVFDLTNTQKVPPNYVTFTVGGLIAGEDRVLVGPESAGAILETQFVLNGALTSGVSTTAVMIGDIPSDTPSSGTIRIHNGDTFFLQPYTSWTSKTFTLDGTALDDASDAVDVFISYVDTLATIYTVATALNAAATTSVVVTPVIATSGDNQVAAAGTLKIALDNGSFLDVAYSSYTGSTFTITSTDFDTNGASVGQGVYEKGGNSLTTTTFTSVYSTDRSLFIRVRDGGGTEKSDTPIKTFETTGTLGSAGGSTTAIRTNDS